MKGSEGESEGMWQFCLLRVFMNVLSGAQKFLLRSDKREGKFVRRLKDDWGRVVR